MKKIIDEGDFAGSIFLDLTKAFDTIDHLILSKKLELIGICGPPLLLLKSCLHSRIQIVSVSDAVSDMRTTNLGVPQGSVLGPLLFLIFINDMPNCLKHSQCMLYADDSMILNSANCTSALVTKLNSDIANVQEWCNNNKLQINL